MSVCLSSTGKAVILYTPANTIIRRVAMSKNKILHTALVLQTKIDLVFGGKNETLLTHPRVRVRISRKKAPISFFYVRSFVCQSAFTSAAPTGWISVKFNNGGGASTKICRGTPNVVKIGQQYRLPYMMRT